MSDHSTDKTTLTVERMIQIMRDHDPPRDVYRGKYGGYWLSYPGDEKPRLQVPREVIQEALMRGLIRVRYPGQQYWELA